MKAWQPRLWFLAGGCACWMVGSLWAGAPLSSPRTGGADVGPIAASPRDLGLPSAAALDVAPPAGVVQPEEPAPSASEVELPEIDRLVTRAVNQGKTPGAVVLVGRRSGVIFRKAYGQRALLPDRVEVTPDTIFDLASLTKPIVVGTLVQWLVEQGRLRLDERVASHVPEFGVRGKQDITVEQLLLHTSGLPPTNPLSEYRDGAERSRLLALGSWLSALPGRHFIYSDVGYIALGVLIERITGEALDQTAERVLWGPLGMSDTRYCRLLCTDPRVAPTDLAYGWQRSPIRGEVHDPRAYRLGGVAGHAGLFSTVDDLARFARMLLGSGELDGQRVLSPASVSRFTDPHPVPRGRRALGWDMSTTYSSARGLELSERAYGHGGHTGTSLWIDPQRDLFVVFLSNRNHPYGTGKVTDLQGEVANAAVRALEPAAPVAVAQPCVMGEGSCSGEPVLLRATGG